MVLGQGGPLTRLALPFRFFLGGPVGSGRQWTSWIHVEDVAGACLFAAGETRVKGPVNAVAGSRRNRELARAVGGVLGRPARLRTPEFALRMALGEFSDYVLSGRRVVPSALNRAGYEFRFPELEPALKDALG
jgi:NAD dependent epimerase/dehydratase family enzyme